MSERNDQTVTVPQDTIPSTAPVQDRQEAAPDSAGNEHLAPVAEAIRYRQRAQAAERRIAEYQDQLHKMGSELEQARQNVGRLERRQKIDTLLADADAIDIEAARLLTEAAVALMSEPDLKLAIADLRRHKPWLFRQHPQGPGAAAMPAKPRGGTGGAESAAREAALSGDRRDLLRYLRLRRGAAR